jgi:hypothetical protein
MIDAAKAVGQLPHEFLAAIARGETIDGHEPTFEERMDAAKHAAPYYAPKLANIEATVAVSSHEAALEELE